MRQILVAAFCAAFLAGCEEPTYDTEVQRRATTNENESAMTLRGTEQSADIDRQPVREPETGLAARGSTSVRQRLISLGLTEQQVQQLSADNFDSEETAEMLTATLRERGMDQQRAEQEAQRISRQITLERQQQQPPPQAQTDAQQQRDVDVQDSAQIALREETLDVQKQQVPAGGILLRKRVVVEDTNQTVQLKTETVEIVRLTPEEAAQRQQQAQTAPPSESQPFTEQEIFIPLMREEATVEKDVTTREYVRARTGEETHTSEIQAQLRKEELDVERVGPGEGPASQQQAQQPQPSQQQQTQAATLEQRIQQALLTGPQNERALTPEQFKLIIVKVENDEVTLTGTVANEQTKNRIEERVKQIEGVRDVKNELEVGEPGQQPQPQPQPQQ